MRRLKLHLIRCYKDSNSIVDLVAINSNDLDGDTIVLMRFDNGEVINADIISENKFHENGIIRIVQNFINNGFIMHKIP